MVVGDAEACKNLRQTGLVSEVLLGERLSLFKRLLHRGFSRRLTPRLQTLCRLPLQLLDLAIVQGL